MVGCNMLKNRLIPVLLLKNGLLVRSESFSIHQIIGDPLHEVKRFNEWNVDELIYLDISETDTYDIGRADTKTKEMKSALDILKEVSKNCFMPLTWGGKIKSVEHMEECFRNGADKIAINTEAFLHPELITAGAKRFGSQAIVVSIDAGEIEDGIYQVFIGGGKKNTAMNVVDWAKKAVDLGAGEILLQSIERDGSGKGYDLNLIRQVAEQVSVPVIACSGVGDYRHYAQAIQAGASAVAAANIWHFKELSDRNGKRSMERAKINIRK